MILGSPIPAKASFSIDLPVPITELKVSDTASVAFVKCDRDERMHRLDGLCIRPGVRIRVHRVFPTSVIECEGAMIVLGKKIAENIYVWFQPSGVGKVAPVTQRSRPKS